MTMREISPVTRDKSSDHAIGHDSFIGTNVSLCQKISICWEDEASFTAEARECRIMEPWNVENDDEFIIFANSFIINSRYESSIEKWWDLYAAYIAYSTITLIHAKRKPICSNMLCLSFLLCITSYYRDENVILYVATWISA